MNELKNNFISSNMLPQNVLIERGILNILLNHPNYLKKTIFDVKVESFAHEPYRLIYKTMIELSENEIPINITIVISKLQEQGILKKIGGIHTIKEIICHFENLLNLEQYIEIHNQTYLKRLIINFGKQLITWGYSTNFSIEQILNQIEIFIFKLNEEKISDKIYSAAEVIENVVEDLHLKNEKNSKSGFLTSFKELDAIVQGFQNSDLIVIAGRQSMGKTAFSLNLAKNMAEKYKIPIIIFSLEMSRQQIIYRFLSSEGKINPSRLKTGKMTLFEWEKLNKSMTFISQLSIYIDDNPNLNLNDIRTKLKKIFSEKKQKGLVIIDYLQLMKVNFKLENRVQEISFLTRNLKIIAKEFDIPVILLSQLSRNLESRVNKRPMLSDLRDSGCVSNVAQEKIKTWNGSNLIFQKSLDFQFKGLKPIYRLIFKNNRKIEISGNHKILTKQGWMKVSELTKNSEIYFLEKKEKKNAYCSIQNIEYYGIESVYDKTIPNFHNYILNNTVLHNSIEQDADIVIMLYREDYYSEKNLNSQLTELIIAKHRNGPVGTARVLFEAAYTTFTNPSK